VVVYADESVDDRRGRRLISIRSARSTRQKWNKRDKPISWTLYFLAESCLSVPLFTAQALIPRKQQEIPSSRLVLFSICHRSPLLMPRKGRACRLPLES